MSLWRQSANKSKVLKNVSPEAFCFICLAMCHKLMPNSHRSTAHIATGRKKQRGEKQSRKWGVDELRGLGGKKTKGDLEAESKENQETVCCCLLELFEYREAAAGVCVEQVCTSHSITIRRTQLWSYSAGVLRCCTHSHKPAWVHSVCGNESELLGSH